jgi:predicted protein tyrosine phosphatase
MIPKVLFACNQNQNRSKTAEELFKGQYDTASAGLYNYPNQVTAEQVEWADVIIVFEAKQKQELSNRFPKECSGKEIINLDIPDLYDYNVPPLVIALKQKMEKIRIIKK